MRRRAAAPRVRAAGDGRARAARDGRALAAGHGPAHTARDGRALPRPPARWAGVRVWAAAAVAALFLTSCAAALQPAGRVPVPAPGAPDEILLLAQLDPIETTALKTLAHQFEAAQNHRVRVRIVGPEEYLGSAGAGEGSGPGDAGSQAAPAEAPDERLAAAALAAAQARVAPPQAVLLDAAALDRLLAAGALAPPPAAAGAELQPVAAQAAALARPAPAVGAAAGARVALPLDVDVDVVYVRVGFLTAPPTSWSEISGLGRASAPAVAQAGGRLQPGLAVGRDDAALIAGLAAAYGAPPAAAAPAPDAAALDGPAGDAAASQLARWLHDGDLWPAADPVAAFTDGRAGAILAPASAIGPIEAALGGHASFMTGTLPGMPARVRVLALLPYGPPRSRAGAAAFAAFLEQPEPQAVWAAQTGRLPASQKALDTATWRAYASHHPEVARWAAGLAQATAWPPDGAAAALDAARARLALLFGTGTGGASGGGR